MIVSRVAKNWPSPRLRACSRRAKHRPATHSRRNGGMMKPKGVGSVLAVALLSACAQLTPPPKKAAPVRINQDPYPSTYHRYPGALTVIRGATLFDGEGGHIDGNEATSPVRAEVWAEHSVWPQDPGFSRALMNGGVTALQVLPGSANLFGGRSVTLKNVPARTVQGMKFPGAPYGLKMACGENPKRVYGSKGNMPQTRMGNIAYARGVWLKAQ